MRYGFLVGLMFGCLAGQVYGQAPVAEEAVAPAPESTETSPAEAAPAPEVPIYASRALRDMTLVAQAMPSDQVLWWPEDEGQVLALYNAAISAEPVGAVLFVQDQDLHAARPQRLQHLRLALPEFGWTTLMVTLPVPDALPLPERDLSSFVSEPLTESGATADEEPRPETEEVFDDQAGAVASVDELNQPKAVAPAAPAMPTKPARDIADARLAQAVKHLHQQGQFNLVLVAEGAGAVRAARLLAKMGFEGFRALVLLDGRNKLQGEDGDVIAAIEKMSVPMLDLYEGQHLADTHDVEARRVAAKRAGHKAYLSLQMPVYEPGYERLIKRVRGFLDTRAKGVKVDNAQVIDGE